MNNNKTIAVILTRNGTEYSDEEKDFAANHLRNAHNAGQVILLGGKIYNKPSALKDLIEKNLENTYVILSLTEDIYFIPPENNENIVYELERHEAEKTSWEIVYAMCEQGKKS